MGEAKTYATGRDTWQYCDCCGEQLGGGSDMDEDDGLCGGCRIVERRKIESGRLIAENPIVAKADPAREEQK
jgi:hypothetical protein